MKIGLSFFEAETVIDDIEPHDIPLDYCVTPKRFILFKIVEAFGNTFLLKTKSNPTPVLIAISAMLKTGIKKGKIITSYKWNPLWKIAFKQGKVKHIYDFAMNNIAIAFRSK